MLISRLLNNLSRIDIEYSFAPDVIAQLTQVRNLRSPTTWHPADCLRGPAPLCDSLIALNASTRLLGGTTFHQASLSDYYRGLYRIHDPVRAAPDNRCSLFLPLRQFNVNALLLSDGSIILERLG